MKKRLYNILLLWLLAANTGYAKGGDSLLDAYRKAASADQAVWLNKMAFRCVGSYPDSAIKLSSRALRLARYYNDYKQQGLAYKVLGEAHQYLSNFQQSVSYYFSGIKLAEKNHDQGLLGALYNGLGVDFYYMGDYTKSIHYMSRSAEIKLKLGDESSYAMILTNLGGVLHSVGKHDSAMQVLRSAEKVLVKNNTVVSLTSLYNSMGSIQQVAFKNFDSAAYFYQNSLRIANENNLTEHQATAYHNLGGVYNDTRKFTEAITHLQKALVLGRSIKRHSLILGVYRTFAETYTNMGDFKNALMYKSMQLDLRDSIFQEEKNLSVVQMEARYQSAKKDEQIQRQIVQSEKESKRFTTILFVVLLLLILALAVAVYFWQRKKTKEKLETEKSKIYQNIVHEIRTPLTLINGPLQNIKKKLNDADSQEDVQLIERNSGRLIYLVNELLDAAKLENKQFKVQYQFGNAHAFIGEVVASFNQEAGARLIQLRYAEDTSGYNSNFPVNVLEKAAGNLIANAIKYCPTGTEVHITLHQLVNELILTVSDNGPGIPLNEQSQIFNRFYRGSAHRNMSGTGIGLSMVKEMAELIGGKVTLTSKPGNGTRVEVILPVKKSSESVVSVEVDDEKPSIVLVEDDADVALFTERLLKEKFTVIKAENGKLGLESCRTHIPDMVLTDVMMPEMDGIELITELKKDETTAHIPVVIFSAKSSTESRLLGLQSGADGYLPKPFNPEELKLLVNNILQTVRKNQKEYQQGLTADVPFRERLSGGNVYLGRIIDQIIAHLENTEYSVNELADDMYVSRSQLHRNIKSITGHSTTYLIKLVRIEKAKDMLHAQAGNITEIAYACGFASQSYFTRTFSEIVGVPPSLYRK